MLSFIQKSVFAGFRSTKIATRVIGLQRTMNLVVPVRRYAAHAERCDAHMNELPIPCGPWDIWYRDKQSIYNKVLVLGILWWLFSLFMLIYTESLFLNWGPPAQPGPPSDMVEECEDIE